MEKEFEINIVQALCIIESGWSSKNKNRQDLYWHAKRLVSEEAEKICLKYELFRLDEKLGELPKPPKSIKNK